MKTIYIATWAQHTLRAGKVCSEFTQEELEAIWYGATDNDSIVIHCDTVDALKIWAQDIINHKGYGTGSNSVYRWTMAENVLNEVNNG